MNRLILLGNGFDLAHGMKTSYNDFLKWYLTNCFEIALHERTYQDTLITIERQTYTVENAISAITSSAVLIENLYKQGFQILLYPNVTVKTAGHDTYTLPFRIVFESSFLKKILQNCSYLKWVDIENSFYSILKLFARDTHGTEEIRELNNAMDFMIRQLSSYLLSISPVQPIKVYKDLFWEPVLKDEQIKLTDSDIEVDKIMVLNFNYTDTAGKYVSGNSKELNYIHGNIYDPKNPIIFGFGDELDANYQLLEDANNNALLKYIKSFGYLKTDNYTDLIRFIQDGEYQIYVMGHSCGLSDRTMLHTVFENKNCKSIKIFYYVDKEGINNFEQLTQEISRHFKDKESLREKVVKFPHTKAMPQH